MSRRTSPRLRASAVLLLVLHLLVLVAGPVLHQCLPGTGGRIAVESADLDRAGAADAHGLHGCALCRALQTLELPGARFVPSLARLSTPAAEPPVTAHRPVTRVAIGTAPARAPPSA